MMNVAVIGAGKMGLPLAVQYALQGWQTIAADANPAVVESINKGAPLFYEPGLQYRLTEVLVRGHLRATTDTAAAVASSDVVVVVVPVTVTDLAPDFTLIDNAVCDIAAGLRPGTLVLFETTVPIGTTRTRFTPALEAGSGLVAGVDFFVAFSPERLYSGRAFEDLAAYPKLVGGIDDPSRDRAVAFYRSALAAQVKVVPMSSAEAAEYTKLAETTYRDVNIALANEFAMIADDHGLDVQEVIAAANSQPYSHIHQPGIGVGGHCIPVYPWLLLSGLTSAGLVIRAGRLVNDDGVERALAVVEDVVALRGASVLVVGLTYRSGVKELAQSRGVALLEALLLRGAEVSAYDPLLDEWEIRALGAEPWVYGTPSRAQVIVTQTDSFDALDPAWFPKLRVVYDGRNSLRGWELPGHVTYIGVGQRRGARMLAEAPESPSRPSARQNPESPPVGRPAPVSGDAEE